MSISVFPAKMKGLAGEMAAIGKPLPEDELICYILAGLGGHYNALMAALGIIKSLLLNCSHMINLMTSIMLCSQPLIKLVFRPLQILLQGTATMVDRPWHNNSRDDHRYEDRRYEDRYGERRQDDRRYDDGPRFFNNNQQGG
jgi:hypothetical protein